MNKSGNGIRRPEVPVKLPKVSTIGNSSVSNTSMKAILDNAVFKRTGGNDGSMTSGSK